MSQIHKHSIPANIADSCLINPEQYKAQYHQSVTDPDAFLQMPRYFFEASK